MFLWLGFFFGAVGALVSAEWIIAHGEGCWAGRGHYDRGVCGCLGLAFVFTREQVHKIFTFDRIEVDPGWEVLDY